MINRLLLFFVLVFTITPLNAEPIILKFWDFPRWLEPGEKTDRFVWITRKIAEFERENPNIKIELTKLTWQRGYEKLKIAAISGSQPDIAPGKIPLLFIQEGLVEPVNEYLSTDDFGDYISGTLESFTHDGKIYGFPWYMSGQILYANLDMLAQAGVSIPNNGAWSAEEFVEVLRKIKRSMNGKIGHYPMGVYFQKDETANLPFLQQFGGSIIDSEGRYAANNPEFISGLRWVKNLANEGLIPPDSGGRTSSDVWNAFGVEKRFAIAALGLWGIVPLQKKCPMNFAVVKYPNNAKNYIGTSGYYIFKNKDKERVKAAAKFIKFITSGENQKSLNKYSQFPTRKSAGNIYVNDKHMSEAWNALQNGTTVYADSRWPQIDEEFSAAVQESLLSSEKEFDAYAQNKMDDAGYRINQILSSKSSSLSQEMKNGRIFSAVIAFVAIIAFVFALCAKQTHLLMVVPAIGVLVLFLFCPLAEAVTIAFRDYRFGEVGSFTFSNFTRAFADPKFKQACWNTLIYTVLVVPANTFVALVVAGLVSALHGFWKRFFRAAYYLPGVASVVVLTMVWRYMFNTEVGLFNEILRFFGFGPIGWLSDKNVAFFSVVISNIIKSPGGAMLIYLASMANIPQSLYEAAELDGAGCIKKWWYVTVPLLRNTTMFLLVMGTITALQVFAQVLMLTDGGPGISTQVIVYRVYTSAFRDFDFGLSSAIALILFIAILCITIAQRHFGGKETEYLA